MTTHDEPVEIASGSASLKGVFVAPEQPVPGVLFVHGWGGSHDRYLARARAVAALGCVGLTFDLTGHGASKDRQQKVSREENLRDVVAAYDHLAAHAGVDPRRIAVVGSSYGGYLAAILSAERPIRWLALRAPALYIDSGWEVPKAKLHEEQHLESWRRTFVPATENQVLRDCAAFEGDVLLIESEFDEVIPRAVIASYLEAFDNARSLTYRVLAGADHGLTQETSQRAFSALLVNWMTEMAFSQEEAVLPQGAARASEPPEAPRGLG